MNLEQRLEIARTRAEKSDTKPAISKSAEINQRISTAKLKSKISEAMKKEYAELEQDYGVEFARTKHIYDGLETNEGFYDSVEEQMQRRNEYITDCEAEIRRLKQEQDFWKSLVSGVVNNEIEKHIKSASWNLNRIATVIEQWESEDE